MARRRIKRSKKFVHLARGVYLKSNRKSSFTDFWNDFFSDAFSNILWKEHKQKSRKSGFTRMFE